MLSWLVDGLESGGDEVDRCRRAKEEMPYLVRKGKGSKSCYDAAPALHVRKISGILVIYMLCRS